jgi:hypothetical protein
MHALKQLTIKYGVCFKNTRVFIEGPLKGKKESYFTHIKLFVGLILKSQGTGSVFIITKIEEVKNAGAKNEASSIG